MNPAALLLADPSVCLRWRVLKDLFGAADDDPELLALQRLRASDPLVTGIVTLQEADGAWRPNTLASGRMGGSRVLMTAYALSRLGYLGFDRSFPAVQRGVEFLLAQQAADGSWPLTDEIALTDGNRAIPAQERYSMIPLQTVFPLRALAACGYAADPPAERAYDWLLAQRLPDGAWPTGVAAGVYGYVAGYRRLSHSRWGCRSNTTGALLCLALHPERRKSEPAQRALDLILGRETKESYAVGVEVARLTGAEPAHGFLTYFARFDLALILDLCSRIGVTEADERLGEILKFLVGLRNEFGLWQYPEYPQISRWLTYDLLRSLAALEQQPAWMSNEPRTPFQPYPKTPRRF